MTGDASGDSWRVGSLVEEKTLESGSLGLDPGTTHTEYVPLWKLANLLSVYFLICKTCMMMGSVSGTYCTTVPGQLNTFCANVHRAVYPVTAVTFLIMSGAVGPLATSQWTSQVFNYDAFTMYKQVVNLFSFCLLLGGFYNKTGRFI